MELPRAVAYSNQTVEEIFNLEVEINGVSGKGKVSKDHAGDSTFNYTGSVCRRGR